MGKLDELISKYPKAFESDWYGFECQDGWADIIEPVIKAINEHNINMDHSQGRYIYPVQVKEKFGTLRFYSNYYDLDIDMFINEAEHKSVTTCETCGKQGELIQARWLYTACPDHIKEGNIPYSKFLELREMELK